ncbi:hypothetical protein DICPUDRAFT_148436 [Dictyostelium purpureum]|uniref:Saposin B-type domain-containing protein n=1 Tax=Dictyostelium purpureum TaxID=5786 RepID=F0ZB46_DICPU|nr:uncharacterized protein DICPUDRAFT_148436 [Dictyostelium purpureum]EGC38855.1 hypothetical protein DICPUDRAFT_148436 [Dictyostelium purpureum]|eukprot:XP_003284649.1 hypothetical protein DICPUDRAFT_148436 [Dictyostelium purpureum]
MKFLITLLVLIVLINSSFAAISILDLKQKCNNYCNSLVETGQNAAANIINHAGLETVRHAANDFEYVFPQQYNMIKTFAEYFSNDIGTCSNACKILIERELFDLNQNENQENEMNMFQIEDEDF